MNQFHRDQAHLFFFALCSFILPISFAQTELIDEIWGTERYSYSSMMRHEAGNHNALDMLAFIKGSSGSSCYAAMRFFDYAFVAYKCRDEATKDEWRQITSTLIRGWRFGHLDEDESYEARRCFSRVMPQLARVMNYAVIHGSFPVDLRGILHMPVELRRSDIGRYEASRTSDACESYRERNRASTEVPHTEIFRPVTVKSTSTTSRPLIFFAETERTTTEVMTASIVPERSAPTSTRHDADDTGSDTGSDPGSIVLSELHNENAKVFLRQMRAQYTQLTAHTDSKAWKALNSAEQAEILHITPEFAALHTRTTASKEQVKQAYAEIRKLTIDRILSSSNEVQRFYSKAQENIKQKLFIIRAWKELDQAAKSDIEITTPILYETINELIKNLQEILE